MDVYLFEAVSVGEESTTDRSTSLLSFSGSSEMLGGSSVWEGRRVMCLLIQPPLGLICPTAAQSVKRHSTSPAILLQSQVESVSVCDADTVLAGSPFYLR